ncbi:MAG: hypothetical protein PF542_04825 [Nanoarchaeota archaeon]|jgi:hypothetical protein|nr:hypothetical protein [Nanoarchaeota archaeon]
MAKEVIEEVSTTKVNKKSVPKEGTKRKTKTRKIISRPDRNLEKILIENFISMQKVMTHLVSKFDKLENQISGLLNLFEQSAETLAKKDINLEIKGNEEKQQEIIDKLKNIFEQNKLVAKGLTLMHKAAVDPNISYAIGRGDEKEAPQTPQQAPRQAPPQTPPQQMMTSRRTATEDNTQPPEVTSGGQRPKVMEEQGEFDPTFSM